MIKKLLSGFCAGVLLLVSTSAAYAETTLTLVNFSTGDSRYAYACEAFAQAHPNVKIQHQTVEKPMDILSQLRNQAQEWDIISTYNLDLTACQREGLLEDLSNVPALMTNLERWPSLSMFTSNGALLAIPTRVTLWLMHVSDLALAKNLGLEMPREGWTWDDFFRMGEQLAAFNDANGTQYQLAPARYLPYWIEQYANNEMYVRQEGPTFDTPVFRSLLAGYKKLVEMQVVPNSFDVEFEQTFLFEIELTSYSSMAEQTFVQLPVYAGCIRPTIAYAHYAFVNAQSGRKDLAVEFLTYFTSPDAVLDGGAISAYYSSGIFLDGDEAYWREHALPEGAEQTTLDKLLSRLRATPENDLFWRAQYEQATRHNMTLFESGMDVLIDAYMADAITLDGAVWILDMLANGYLYIQR